MSRGIQQKRKILDAAKGEVPVRKRHACKVCIHPNRAGIEKAMRRGLSDDIIAATFGTGDIHPDHRFTPRSLSKHKRECLSTELMQKLASFQDSLTVNGADKGNVDEVLVEYLATHEYADALKLTERERLIVIANNNLDFHRVRHDKLHKLLENEGYDNFGGLSKRHEAVLKESSAIQSYLQLLAKLGGAIDESTKVYNNITIEGYVKLKQLVIDVCTEHPEIKEAVLSGIKKIESNPDVIG